ncbi:MAG: tripartite tricarboxylate transporter substrate binding protein [Hydrogenophaga sp.]|uniref:Bug family tripartite tricarboxylate transporter substrate binding protein n=1 Tax=Hydrogenophaga sp. TaxID=1904254 RepID=UPI001E021C54|nr:tripartite tricarboxylate transporter substrate binding protein [Hydrogenophaga sp.]MBX3608707.1 tripartite tricarboxylate transporter substrate binding protein [Hydrogenophaga sp.]
MTAYRFVGRLAACRGRWLASALVAFASLGLMGGALAQSDFPNRTVKLVVPFAAGGSDTMARAFAEKLSVILQQPVIVENKPGGAALIGTNHVAQQPADGYTMLWLGGGSLTPVLIKDLKFEILKSLRSVVSIARGGMTLMVPGSMPVNNFAEFLAYAKANPGKLNYSHTAGSILLSAEMLKAKAGFEAVAIPYKGSTQVATALMTNEIQMGIDVPVFYLGMIKDGRIKAIAHGGQERSPSLPDVPTLAEVGVRDLTFAFSYGIWVPAGTPDPVVNKLNAAFNEVLKDPAIRDRLSQAGVVPVGGGVDVHAQNVKAEQDMWAAAAKQIDYHPQ